jgi:hypothetical protein
VTIAPSKSLTALNRTVKTMLTRGMESAPLPDRVPAQDRAGGLGAVNLRGGGTITDIEEKPAALLPHTRQAVLAAAPPTQQN